MLPADAHVLHTNLCTVCHELDDNRYRTVLQFNLSLSVIFSRGIHRGQGVRLICTLSCVLDQRFNHKVDEDLG